MFILFARVLVLRGTFFIAGVLTAAATAFVIEDGLYSLAEPTTKRKFVIAMR